MAKKRRLNREIVIAAAATLADEMGEVEPVTLAAVAAALDVRPPSLYNHVSGLEDLRQATAVYALQKLLTIMRQATAGKVGREGLEAAAVAYRQFAHKHPGIYPLTIRAPDPHDEPLTSLTQELLQLLLLLFASAGVQGEDALHAIRGLRALLHGFVSLEASEGYKLPLNREESFRRLLTNFLDGLLV